MVPTARARFRRHGALRRAVVAGDGVAALEAALALTQLAPDLLDVHLLTPERQFAFRSQRLWENGSRPTWFDIPAIARRMGATLHRDRMESASTSRRCITTASGEELDYDWLIAAPGATTASGVRGDGVVTLHGAETAPGVRAVLRAAADGDIQHLAFAVPSAAGWPLPLYELALAASSRLARLGKRDVTLSVVSDEGAPLSLFGARASARTALLLHRHGIRLRLGLRPAELRDGKLAVVPAGVLAADSVISAPRYKGPWVPGLPHDRHGFIPTDLHGSVPGVTGVFAAGEATTQPLKHGALAVRQADAAAEAVAAAAGAAVIPFPFRPRLRRKPARMVGKYLAPFLAAGEGADVAAIYEHLRNRSFAPNIEPVELASV